MLAQFSEQNRFQPDPIGAGKKAPRLSLAGLLMLVLIAS
jgi:hypothetical protein